jgi:hypothetical protein
LSDAKKSRRKNLYTSPIARRPVRRVSRAISRRPRGLVFLVLVVVTLSQEPDELLYAWPPVFRVALAFPLLAIPLTLGCLYFVVRAWREGF